MLMNQPRRIKSEIGTVAVPIPARSGGVKEIEARGWMLLKVNKVKVRIRTILAPGHQGKPVTIEEITDWPGRKDRTNLRQHVSAVAQKYRKMYMAGEWPASSNYLTHCNSRASRGFIDTNCNKCTARYCTVPR